MTRIALALLVAAFAAAASAQTLTVWVWDINKPALESTLDSFHDMHPDVEVVIEDLGNQNVYDRGLAGCAAGGFDMPDVYLVENNEAEVFWHQFPDCFLDLRELGAEELLPLFPDFKWSELTVGDTIHAIPYDSGPTAVFYRRDLYEQAGIDPATIETWEDFAEAGTRMNDAFDGNVKMATVSKGGDDEWFRMLANQAGCFYFDQDASAVTVAEPGCVQAMETLDMLWDASVLHSGGWVEQIQFIQNDVAASAYFGSWYAGVIQAEAPDQEGQWGVYRAPAFEEGGVRASNLGGSALAIPASTDHAEIAYDFVTNALADEQNQLEILFEHGLTPSLLSLQDAPELEQGVPFFNDQPIWAEILPTLGEVPPVSGTQYFEEAREVMTVVVSDFLDGRYDSAEDALSQAARQISSSTGLPIAD